MSENRCRRCNRRISDMDAQYGEKCAKILGHRNPKTDRSERMADIEHITHEKIARLDKLGIDWRRGVGQEMLYDMVSEEYTKGFNASGNPQEPSRTVRRPPRDVNPALKEPIIGAIPKADRKADLLAERLPAWYQKNMEYSEEKIGYGDKRFEEMGCGALAMAMIIKGLTGTAVSPLELAKYAVENDHYHGNGIEASFFSPVAENYGLAMTEIDRSDKKTAKGELIENLRQGNPVIAHMGPGTFTDGGHYMVLAGVSEDGSKVLVYDGGNRNRFNKYYDTDLILDECKGNFRAFTYDGKYKDDGTTFK